MNIRDRETGTDVPQDTSIFWSWKASVGMFILVLLLTMSIGAIAQVVNIFVGIVITEILIAGPVVYYVVYRHKRSFSIFKIQFDRELLTDFGYGAIAAIIGYPLATMATILTQYILGPSPFGEAYVELLGPKSVFELILWFILMAFVVAPCEEIYARGFVQRGFENSFGRWKGLILGGIFFGLLHVDPWRIPATATLGIVFGYVYQKRNYRLTAPIITHFLNNAFAVILLYIAISQGLL